MERLAEWSYRHRWLAVCAWLVILAGTAIAARAVGSDYHNDHSLPGTDSQRVYDLLDEHGRGQAGDSLQIVVRHPAGLAQARDRVAAMLDQVRGLPRVAKSSGSLNDIAISHDG